MSTTAVQNWIMIFIIVKIPFPPCDIVAVGKLSFLFSTFSDVYHPCKYTVFCTLCQFRQLPMKIGIRFTELSAKFCNRVIKKTTSFQKRGSVIESGGELACRLPIVKTPGFEKSVTAVTTFL
jgi:hypothetical protein